MTQPVEGSPPFPLALLDLWHLLSLDAPTVAVVWLLFVGVSVGQGTEPVTASALFIAVWAVYAGDRLLDAHAVPHVPPASGFASELELRHHFHRRHRRWFGLLLLCLLPALGWLLCDLPEHILVSETILAILLAGWLLRVHGLRKSRATKRLAKEFVVGLFFALAIYLPSAASTPNKFSLLPGAALLAFLCTLNCLFLYAWEHGGDLSHAHPATAFAVTHLPSLSIAGFVAAALTWFMERSSPLGWVPLACALSVSLLMILHASRRRFQPLRLRALADFVLLTPVPLLVLRRLFLHGFAAYR